ncbi:MAG: preprotein translocase subunit SecA [Rubrivivax sp.]|nr:MAG: preprotein translocase subunit SecA [Rubrivivax sp.]
MSLATAPMCASTWARCRWRASGSSGCGKCSWRGCMSDASLARKLAGSSFRRADTHRDERANEKFNRIESWLADLPALLGAAHLSRRTIGSFGDLVGQMAKPLQSASPEGIGQRYRAELARLKGAPHDEQALAGLFACIGLGSKAALGMWPHPVQFAGARVLLTGRLSEMQTGEGKTLVAGLAATAMAGSGAHVHVVSTNDYLAQRDSEEMAPLFAFFGLSVAFVREGMEPDERKAAYRCDICYVSGKELVFDYLKDRLAGHGVLPSKVTQLHRMLDGDAAQTSDPLIPALHFAIVDEADSVLIDEARTPMILSKEAPGLHEPEILAWATRQAARMVADVDYKSIKGRDFELLPGALDRCEPVPATAKPVWGSAAWRQLLLRQALTARHLFNRDQHYILAEGKVQIVDESTGRVMPDRSWEQGLHQLIESKEGLECSAARETLARMTFQRFFRRYFLLSGLTGTAAEATRELWAVYRLKVVRIPTHKVSRRARLVDLCQPSFALKWQTVADDAQAAAARGQPVLIGTRSVEASEQLAAELVRRGIDHRVLNARQDAEEASIVASAGQPGRITVATNMAGRGTDIKLTPESRQAGGLHVILTEFHESARVDRQLFGRSGRQGDPGTARAIVCAQDVLFKQEGGWLAGLLARPMPDKGRRVALNAAVRWAQRRAQKQAYKARMQTMKQDRQLSRLIGFAGKTL